MGENTRQNCTRQNKKKNPGRKQACWGSLFCTNLTQPTGNLDSRSTQEIMEVLKELHRSGRTVILITHDDEIAAQVNRVIRIKDGKVEADFINEQTGEKYNA